MKKVFIILAFLPLLFFGCSKSKTDDPKPEEKLYKVNFSAKVMEIELSPIGFKASTSTSTTNKTELFNESIRLVEFYLYDKSENLVSSQSLELFDVSGNIQLNALNFSAELPKGDYTIGIIPRSNNTSMYKDTRKENHFLTFDVINFAEREIVNYTPVYIHKFSKFTVSDQEVNNQLKLNRLNSQIELSLLDKIPSNVKYLLFGGNISRYIYPFNASFTNANGGKSFIAFDLDSVKNETNKVLKMAFYPEFYSNDEVQNVKSYDVLLYDKDYKYLGTKTIENVYFRENYITRLKGNFFDTLAPENKSTSIKVDFVHQYNSNVIETRF